MVAFCALVSLALLNCADLTAVPMATFGSAPRPADDVAAYAQRMIAEAALGSIQTSAGTPPQLYVMDELTCDVTDVPWSTHFVSCKGGVNGAVLTALMPLSTVLGFREGEQVRACNDGFNLSGFKKAESGCMKNATFSCSCGAAKPLSKKEKAAIAARAVKREAVAGAAPAQTQPAAPQETAAAEPLLQGCAEVALEQQGATDRVECSGGSCGDGPQYLAPPPPAAAQQVKPPAAEAKKHGERGEGAAPTKKIGCPVRFTASLREETHDGEPVYLVTYLEWDHADGCKVLAPRMTSEACKARLIGYFQSRPSLAAWEAVKLNCTFVATEYARLHPDVTDISELEALWQQVRWRPRPRARLTRFFGAAGMLLRSTSERLQFS